MKGNVLYAKPHEGGMAIYVMAEGEAHFVMTHRKNNQLFFFLKDGRRLDEVKGYRPSRRMNEQAMSHSLEHIVRVVDYVLEYEVGEAA